MNISHYVDFRLQELLNNGVIDVCDPFPIKDCLTLNLSKRLTSYDPRSPPNNNNDIKVMVGVSGCGKTRTMLEILHQYHGIYLTAVTSPLFGSDDLFQCQQLSQKNPGECQKNITVLLAIRLAVVKWLMTQLNCTPRQVLWAQLRPDIVFGTDLFRDIFLFFQEHQNVSNIGSVNCGDLVVAVDEVQYTLKNRFWFQEFSKNRPFFSPLIFYAKKMAKLFIVAGTGIHYQLLRDCLRSSALNQDAFYQFVEINNFPFLNAEIIASYAHATLQRMFPSLSTDNLNSIVEAIADFKLCHGRARLCCFIIDRLYEKKDRMPETELLAFLPEIFDRFRTLVATNQPPLSIIRFMNDDDDWRIMVIGEKTVATLLENMVVDSLVNGSCSITVSEEDSVKCITLGIGFRHKIEHGTVQYAYDVVLCEPAVMVALAGKFQMKDIGRGLTDQLRRQPTRSSGGTWFEYLAAYNIGASFSTSDMVTRISIFMGSFESYLMTVSHDNQHLNVYFPDNFMGPDAIIVHQSTMWLYQMKRHAELQKSEQEHACRSVNPAFFYCVRNPKSHNFGKVLRGFSKTKDALMKALEKYTIKRVVIAATQVSSDLKYIEPNVQCITRFTDPDDLFQYIRPIDMDKDGFWKLISG